MDKITPQRLLHEGLFLSADKTPEKKAIICGEQSYSYAKLLDKVLKLSSFFLKKGFKRGDRCVIFCDNSIVSIVSIYSTLITGGIFVVINPQTKKDKLEYILNDCSASILITDAHLHHIYVDVIDKVKSLSCVIASGATPDFVDDSVIAYDDAFNWEGICFPQKTIIANDLCALIYTSGSTGQPKGVMQTHLSMTFALNSIIEYLRLSSNDRILLVLPLAFDYGLYQLLMTIQLGATLVLEKSFTYPAEIFQRIEETEITVLPGVPTIFSMLISMHARNAICFPSITRVTNTAAALPPAYVDTLKEIFPSALIFKMYGLTECKRVCYLEPEILDHKPASVGKAIPGTEVFILNQLGEPAAPFETGILYVRGPHVMSGYWNQPELSNSVLQPGKIPGEKVLCTNDWFKMDEDGDLYFQGRSDDIIKTRGEKVSPVEIENVLHGIPGVRESAIVGVDDEILGQAIKCLVVIEPGADLTLMDIKRECVENLENFMVPKYFELKDSLPKTDTGKISKKGVA